MSEENVRLVKELLVAWTGGDVEACVAAFDSEGEWIDPPDMPGATVHRGHDSIRSLLESFKKYWANWSSEADEVRTAGADQVFVQGRARGRGRASGVEVDRPFYLVAHVQDGLLMQLRFFAARHQALEAAGLSE